MYNGLDSPFLNDIGPGGSDGHGRVLKKPASSSTTSTKKGPSAKKPTKKPASSSSISVKKKPSTKQKARNSRLKKRVLIADESFLNKNKPGKLSKYGRPKRDQLWIWGAVLQGHSRTHFVFRILKHAEDAYDGRPRGHKEMLQNLRMLGLRKGDIFVSDSWRATVSAVKGIRQEIGVTPAHLPHELVVHNQGEIVNAGGYSTNAIESKWAVLKRWIKRKYGGKLPSHGDRSKWHLLVNEFQARAMLSVDATFDYDHYHTVTVRSCIPIFKM